jgi:hypothetical protein
LNESEEGIFVFMGLTVTDSLPHSPATPQMAPSLLYLYCIVESDTQAHKILQTNSLSGLLPNEPLFPVTAAGLTAAVSNVPGAIFQYDSFNQLLGELSNLAPFALRHNKAINDLLPFAPSVIPISMGAVYRSDQRITELLQDQAQSFHSLLASLRGKQEWEVKVMKDQARLREAAESDSDRLRHLEQEAAQSSPGRAYLLRKQRERLLSSEADRLEGQWLDAILERLTSAGAEAHVDQLPNSPKGPLSLVMKASFLVESSAAAFHSLVAQLEQAHRPHGLGLELSGPWAPYSFVRDRINTP